MSFKREILRKIRKEKEYYSERGEWGANIINLRYFFDKNYPMLTFGSSMLSQNIQLFASQKMIFALKVELKFFFKKGLLNWCQCVIIYNVWVWACLVIAEW